MMAGPAHAHGVQVVGGPGHDVAGTGAPIEAEVERFKMAEEIVAQVELDLARDADDDPTRKELEDSLARGNGQQQQHQVTIFSWVTPWFSSSTMRWMRRGLAP